MEDGFPVDREGELSVLTLPGTTNCLEAAPDIVPMPHSGDVSDEETQKPLGITNYRLVEDVLAAKLKAWPSVN
ncbi:hypothetical protein [Corynebacterium macginleyi]|uniref:hypothetical protein n=1 Tax=Corynebacterium macginleyi TaxID=38290 RepID=UPI001EE4C182